MKHHGCKFINNQKEIKISNFLISINPDQIITATSWKLYQNTNTINAIPFRRLYCSLEKAHSQPWHLGPFLSHPCQVPSSSSPSTGLLPPVLFLSSVSNFRLWAFKVVAFHLSPPCLTSPSFSSQLITYFESPIVDQVIIVIMSLPISITSMIHSSYSIISIFLTTTLSLFTVGNVSHFSLHPQHLSLYFVCSITRSGLTLQPHGLQHTQVSCPLPSPKACPSSCPSSHLIL